MDLERQLNPVANSALAPIIFDLSQPGQRKEISGLLAANKFTTISNGYREQFRELFAVNNPALFYSPDFARECQNAYTKLLGGKPDFMSGRWAYFPWSQKLVHILKDSEFQQLRTARNKNLINEREQKQFYQAVVGIGGLSVGNSAAIAIALQGGAKHIKLADHDTLELSNTNRVRAGISHLGLPKVVVTARQIYEINPYAKVEIFSEGLTEKNLDRFFNGTTKLNIFIDELDNLAIKYLIREKAKRYRVPVVMAADNGDNGILDVERYDLNPKTKFFHGRLGQTSYQRLKNLSKFETGKLIVKLLDIKSKIPLFFKGQNKVRQATIKPAQAESIGS